MYSTYLVFFVIAHILGDFYFQRERLVQYKNKFFRGLLLHSLIYAGSVYAVILPIFGFDAVLYASVFACAHFIIDFAKFIVLKCSKEGFAMRQEAGIYSIDQMLHIACIITICVLLAGQNIPMLGWMQPFFNVIGLGSMKFFQWLCVLLLVAHPANITFKKIFSKYKPQDMDKTGQPNNTGALIGSMERIVSVFLISVGQYAAIGLILTAKSIARYNKIAENKQFAEYYLIGTIFSILFSIVSFIIVF
ncbi:MAG: DUF3307 domain-containing protein [Eubacteriales bacterium]